MRPSSSDTATLTDDSGPTIYGALQDQLGLNLDSKKLVVDTLVVDFVDKVPPEN
jgi:uncharacterized protein (TIGR03435 family)